MWTCWWGSSFPESADTRPSASEGVVSGLGQSTGESRAYCARHRRYYLAASSCELCTYEERVKTRGETVLSRLLQCPACDQMSLLWYPCRNMCECLNLECKLQLADEKDY